MSLENNSFWEEAEVEDDDVTRDMTSSFWDEPQEGAPIADPDNDLENTPYGSNPNSGVSTHKWSKQRIENEYTFEKFLEETQELSKEMEESLERDGRERGQHESGFRSANQKRRKGKGGHNREDNRGTGEGGSNSKKAKVETVDENAPRKSGMKYIATTIPWRYRQNPCPGEMCSRDRGHHGFCVVDMRYKLGLDLTGREVYTHIYKEKQRHQKNIEKFWTMADKKTEQVTKEAEQIREKVQSSKTKARLQALLKRDSAKLRKKIVELQMELACLEKRLDDCDYSIAEEIDTMADRCAALGVEFNFEVERIQAKYQSAAHMAELQLKEKVKEYERFMLQVSQVLVCPFWVLRHRRERPTLREWLEPGSKNANSRKYRAVETNHVLEYIHGSKEGALLGARIYLLTHADELFWEEMLESYKKGKFLQKRIERVTSGAANPQELMHKALAQIYMGHLSRRKYSFIKRVNDSYYDPERQKWVRRKVKVGLQDVKAASSIPYSHIEQFVKRLNMGRVMQVPNHMGVTRTLTSLVLMILDLNLKVPHLKDKIVWFKGRENHFIMQFSDDGAPETKELTMSIGTLTCWNMGEKIRSRELQYMLHGLSVPEKAAIMADLWAQHTSEMETMEGNVYNLHGTLCSLTFEPCADMAWQSWAANEVGQSATYFSPYGNVSIYNVATIHGCLVWKCQLYTTWRQFMAVWYGNVSIHNMATINGSLGEGPDHIWQPWTAEKRIINARKLEDFLEAQDLNLPENVRTAQRREFMIKNKMRQLGKYRIGKYVSQLRPEPMHTEINAWQYLLNLAYVEAGRRDTKNHLLAVLSAPLTQRNSRRRVMQHNLLKEAAGEEGENQDFWDSIQDDPLQHGVEATDSNTFHGCGIPALAKQIVEHERENETRKRLSFRLIGPQAVALARNWHRVCATLKTPDESHKDRLLRLALYKIGLCLREAASLLQSTSADDAIVQRVETLLRIYFNTHVLFFGAESVCVTTWSLAYALPYHMKKLYEKYGVGYGITSMQSREAENAGIKLDLSRTNRSRATQGNQGKWWQVCRWNYVRTFYLPEHHPMPSNYRGGYESRLPTFSHPQACKQCGDVLELGEDCKLCDSEDMGIVTQCAIRGKLTRTAMLILGIEESPENNYADSLLTSEAHTDILRQMEPLDDDLDLMFQGHDICGNDSASKACNESHEENPSESGLGTSINTSFKRGCQFHPEKLDCEHEICNKTKIFAANDIASDINTTIGSFSKNMKNKTPLFKFPPPPNSNIPTSKTNTESKLPKGTLSSTQKVTQYLRELDPALLGDSTERDSIFGGAFLRREDGNVEHKTWPQSEGVRMREFDSEESGCEEDMEENAAD